MKCLIVISHPLENSLCNLLGEHVENTLSQMGHEISIEDLYADNFSPVLTVPERESYYSQHYDSSKITEQVNRLQNTEALVLLFPTWWFSFPAMLKGWFDRIWGPGIAYDHASGFGPIQPRLDNLRNVLVITTLGSPWWVDRIIMRRPVKRVIKRALLGACARNSKLQFLSLYNCEHINEQNIATFKNKIEKALGTWRV